MPQIFQTLSFFATASIVAIASPWLMAAPRDDIASNRAHVVASDGGQCYAKSVPDSLYYSQAGRTTLLQVHDKQDSVLARYPWFAQQMYVYCWAADSTGAVGPSVVRLGPSTRGDSARATDLAISFYHGNKLLRSYSTLAIAGQARRVRASISHYVVIDSVLGYRHIAENRFSFGIRTIDGRVLRFDAGTGRLLTSAAR